MGKSSSILTQARLRKYKPKKSGKRSKSAAGKKPGMASKGTSMRKPCTSTRKPSPPKPAKGKKPASQKNLTAASVIKSSTIVIKSGASVIKSGAGIIKSGYREYTEEDMNEAIELVHGGMPVIDAALKYGIPRATLFNRSRDGCKTHTGRCSEVFARTHCGDNFNLKKRVKSMQYTPSAVEKAIEAVHGGMPVIDASILYNIPRATLFCRSARGCPSHRGRCSTVFSDGKLRRTKAPKHKYLNLMMKGSTSSPAEADTQASGEVGESPYGAMRGIPVYDATTGKVISIKTEESEDEAEVKVDIESTESTQSFEHMEIASGSHTPVVGTAEVVEPFVIAETLTSPIIVKVESIAETDD